MHALGDLDLYFLNWGEPAFASNPLPEFTKARAQHPWLAKSPAGYVIFDYQAIRDIMVQDKNLRPAFDGLVDLLGGKGTPWGDFMEGQIAALSGEEHKLLRAEVATKFTPSSANRLRELMRETMERIIKDWLPKGRIDFEEFSSYYPISVVAQMIGAPVEAVPHLRKSLETLGLGFSMVDNMLDELNRVVLFLRDFMEKLIADHRARQRAPGEEGDMLDSLILAHDEGRISHDRLMDLLLFLFVAGYDTSKNVFTYMMMQMTKHPDVYKRCAEDYDYCAKAVEEALRMFNPGVAFRLVAHDFVYRDVLFPAGTRLFFSLSVSGQDQLAFDDPETFNPDRVIEPGRRHIAFGLGRHVCLGQFLARAALQEGLHIVAQHMTNPRLTDEPTWRPFPGMYGIHGLPMEFDAVY